MDKIESIEGRVLFVIYEMHRMNRITLTQKGVLKDILIGKLDPTLDQIMQEFSQNNDTTLLQSYLLELLSDCSPRSPLELFEDNISIRSVGSLNLFNRNRKKSLSKNSQSTTLTEFLTKRKFITQESTSETKSLSGYRPQNIQLCNKPRNFESPS